MPKQVVNGATLTCTFGQGTSTLVVLPLHRVMSGNQPAANIRDHIPFVNIPPFPLCSSAANPTVIAATAAKAGVATPAACVPAIPAPWALGAPTVLLDMAPALNDTAKCICIWGGLVEIANAGQATEDIP